MGRGLQESILFITDDRGRNLIMAVKIAALDYRSTQANLDSQTTTINNFLSDKTVTTIAVVDEFIMAHYTNIPPLSPTKVKVFNLVDAILSNGIQATETAINNFFGNNVTTVVQNPIALDSGVIVLIYR